MFLRFIFKLSIIALLSCGFYGCSSMSGQSDPALIDAALKLKPDNLQTYILGPGDSVNVNVWRNPDLSTNVPVRPDGKISTPLVGDIVAGGLSPETLSGNIAERLSVFLRDPQVSVVVTGMQSYEFVNRVRVTGAVRGPISVPFRKGMTILDLVLSAGGLSDFADGNDAVLYREYQGSTVVIPVYLQDILENGDISSNHSLIPGDIITIPEKVL